MIIKSVPWFPTYNTWTQRDGAMLLLWLYWISICFHNCVLCCVMIHMCVMSVHHVHTCIDLVYDCHMVLWGVVDVLNFMYISIMLLEFHWFQYVFYVYQFSRMFLTFCYSNELLGDSLYSPYVLFFFVCFLMFYVYLNGHIILMYLFLYIFNTFQYFY